MVAFYNEQDQNIYDNVSKFMPRSKYLRSAPTFTAPTTEEEITETFGIPNTNAFTNSGGDNNFSRSFNQGDFQQVVDARQNRLNNPNKINQFINKGLDFVGMQPQRSYQEMMQSGVTDERPTSGIPLGIGAMIARALPDKYYDMSLADQAYTQANMGYTGPTIFGENNSGLSKDPFGRNVRSFLGNIGDAQEKSIDKFEDLVEGYTTKEYDGKYAGLSLEKDEDGNYSFTGGTKKQIDYANKMHNINLSRYNYDKKGINFRNKLKEQEIRDFNIKAAQDAKNARDLATIQQRAARGDSMSDIGKDMYTGSGQAFEARKDTYTGGKTIDSASTPGGKYGSPKKDGGRIGYFFGGRARLQGGGMSMGNESNQTQSANMGGGATGDFSTGEQTMNHNRAMRDNQKPPESPVTNIINAGSELNYLNNLKNLNLPGLVLGFGVNKFRDFIGNKKTKEEDKLSALPSNNYFADLNAAQIKQLEGPQKMGKEYGNFSDQDILDNITPFGDDETAPATLKDVQTFYGSNGGLASIL